MLDEMFIQEVRLLNFKGYSQNEIQKELRCRKPNIAEAIRINEKRELALHRKRIKVKDYVAPRKAKRKGYKLKTEHQRRKEAQKVRALLRDDYKPINITGKELVSKHKELKKKFAPVHLYSFNGTYLNIQQIVEHSKHVFRVNRLNLFEQYFRVKRFDKGWGKQDGIMKYYGIFLNRTSPLTHLTSLEVLDCIKLELIKEID